MNIRICDLPEDIRNLALQRAKEQNRRATTENTYIIDAFTWMNTPEGDRY